jgi:hypothetical protein
VFIETKKRKVMIGEDDIEMKMVMTGGESTETRMAMIDGGDTGKMMMMIGRADTERMMKMKTESEDTTEMRSELGKFLVNIPVPTTVACNFAPTVIYIVLLDLL